MKRKEVNLYTIEGSNFYLHADLCSVQQSRGKKVKSYLKPVISTDVNCLWQKYVVKSDSFIPGQGKTTFFKAEGIFSEARKL